QQKSCDGCPSGKFAADGAKLLKEVPNYDEFKKKIEGVANNLPLTGPDQSSQSFLNQLKGDLLALSSSSLVSGLLGGATGLGTFLEGTSKVFDFLSGGVGTNTSTGT